MMDELARHGNGDGWVAPFLGQAQVAGHGTQERTDARFLTVDEVAVADLAKGVHEARVDCGDALDPGDVGAW